MTPHAKQFETVRLAIPTDYDEYALDGRVCPACGSSTRVRDDLTRRYCINPRCNAFIKEV